MAGNFKNIRLGPCRIFWGLEELGYTQDGVDVSVASTKIGVKADQFGDNSLDTYVMSRVVTVKVPLVETTPGNLERILNIGDVTSSSSTVKALIGQSMRMMTQTLVLHPMNLALGDMSEDFVVIKAAAEPNISVTYSVDKERVFNITFTSFPYYTTDGAFNNATNRSVMLYGDSSSNFSKYGVANKTARSTIGSYFNEDGVMMFAQPYTPRPNYTYQNGVWVQNGFMKEAQSSNFLSISGGKSLGVIDGIPDCYSDSNNSLTLTSNGPAEASHHDHWFSGYFRKSSTNSSNVINFWWGLATGRPIIGVNVDTGEITGDTSYYAFSASTCGNGWWRFSMNFNSDKDDNYGGPPYISSGSSDWIWGGLQEETNGVTSYIPAGMTRAAD